MATIVFQAAGAALGQFLGGPVGAVIGQTAGAVAGNLVDQRLFGARAAAGEGPRLNVTPALASVEGAPIPRVFGRARVGGQVIWATRFEESALTARAGGKGMRRAPARTTFYYFANFAVGLCEGPIAGVRRIWADGKELDRTQHTIRVHNGAEDQEPDPLIVAKEGEENAPAYRGLAYVVFERMPLEAFGNRIPQLSFELVRPMSRLSGLIRGVDVIPGAGEFVYANRPALVAGAGGSRAENRNVLTHATDWEASIDALQEVCPALESAALVVTWFGDDLRVGQCSIAPRVDRRDKIDGLGGHVGQWSVAGLGRWLARETSRVDGRPAYGGTPSDQSVREAIADLKARGLSVVFYPFVMMDVPAQSGLADPWSDAPHQPAYPWRGRIVCDPAPGRHGSPDGTSEAGAQVEAFFGSADPVADEWSYRRFILHYARLCAEAGGVDAFIIGTEFAALTRVRSAPGVYPAANAFAALAVDVKAILGAGCKVSYAADWTEYGAHALDGGAEVRFPLDVVWSSPAIDCVGVDFYAPLSDWRDGDHLDAQEAGSVYDLDYLRNRVAAGEAFDWFYPDAQARRDQARAPITDGAYGKPWVFRRKDFVGWWSSPHVERVNGVELPQATGWIPRSKPIWLVEIGCPAVDRGANAPNVFPDPKSSENALPHFSRGMRDDFMQQRAIEATISRFDPQAPGFEEAFNPVSPIYGGRMVDPARIHVWAWDARPFPAFPLYGEVWSDGPQWATGHWLNGRLEGASLDALAQDLCARSGVASQDVRTGDLLGCADGYVLDRPMSARAALEPLASLFAFDVAASGGSVSFSSRLLGKPRDLSGDDLVEPEKGASTSFVRAQESELARRLSVGFLDAQRDYRPAVVQSRRIETGSRREAFLDVPLVVARAQAQRMCDVRLQDLWAARETAAFRLRPGRIDVEPGDVLRLPNEPGRAWRVLRLTDRVFREVEAQACEPDIHDGGGREAAIASASAPTLAGPPEIHLLELAIVREGFSALQYAAAFADPWPGAVSIWRREGDGFVFVRAIERPALVGRTLAPLGPGPTSRIDRANELVVRLSGGTLSAPDPRAALAGDQALAVQGPDGAWEIVIFTQAELVGAATWRLTGLVRGLGGRDDLAARLTPAGAAIVRLDSSLVPLVTDLELAQAPQTWRFAPAGRDHSDDLAIEITATASDAALRPYAPVRPRARREADGVRISFIRRSRIDSDGWTALDAPLGEAREDYLVEIMEGGQTRRALSAQTTQVLYAAADEAADFGGPQTRLQIRVSQASASVGRGFSRLVDIDVA